MEEIKEEDIVTVKVQRKTRDKLKSLGKKGESYEDIISELIRARRERMVTREEARCPQ